MAPTLISRLSGPVTLGVGLLLIAAELALLAAYNAIDRVGTLQNPVYLAGGIAYFVAFCGLPIAIVVAHSWQSDRAGAFGLLAAAAAIVGTMFLGGDLWFETFAVPWLGDVAPESFNKVGGLVMVGGFTSYVLFATGWALFGIASLRARVFPWPISLGIVAGGAIGFMALVPPFGLPLGFAITALGLWMSTTSRKRVIASNNQRRQSARRRVGIWLLEVLVVAFVAAVLLTIALPWAAQELADTIRRSPSAPVP